jgi:hypothetical protein
MKTSRFFFVLSLAASLLWHGAGPARAAGDAASVSAHKSGWLVSDQNGNGVSDAGDEIYYRVTVTNTGATAIDAFKIVDRGVLNVFPDSGYIGEVITTSIVLTPATGSLTFTPSGYGFDSHTITPGVEARFANIPANATREIGFRVRIRANGDFPALATALQNIAIVYDDGFPQTEIARTNTTSHTLTPKSDLAFERNQNPGYDAVSGAAVYQILYKNAGPGTAFGASLVHEFPVGAALDATRSAPGWVCGSTQCTYPLGDFLATPPNALFIPPAVSPLVISLTLVPNTAWPSAASVLTAVTRLQANAVTPEYNLANNVITTTGLFGTAATFTGVETYTLHADANNNGLADLGDLLRINVRITNTDLLRTLLSARVTPLSDELRVLRDSIQTTHGSLAPFEPSVDIPELRPGATVSITYLASVTRLPSRMTQRIAIRHRVTDVYEQYQGREVQPGLSVPVFYARNASISSRIDTPSGLPVVSMGDRVTLTVWITNTGVEPLTNWAFWEGRPVNMLGSGFAAWCMTHEFATFTSTLGVATFVPFPGTTEQVLQIKVDTLQPGQSGYYRLNAVIASDFPSNCLDLAPSHAVPLFELSPLTEMVLASQRNSVQLRGPRTALTSQTLSTERGLGTVQPGERVTVTLSVRNVGTAMLSSVALYDSGYTCLTLLTNTITSTQGSVALLPGSPPAIDAQLGALAVDASAQVRFQAIVNAGPACTSIGNSAQFRDAQGPLYALAPLSARIVTPEPPRPVALRVFVPVVRVAK